jgi:hypothetical protein
MTEPAELHLLNLIVEVSRSAPSGSSGCALYPFRSSASLFIGTSSQPPGVYCAALLLVSTTLHCKSEWVYCPVYCKLTVSAAAACTTSDRWLPTQGFCKRVLFTCLFMQMAQKKNNLTLHRLTLSKQ